MLEIIVATKNLGKLKEIKKICPNISFKSLIDLDYQDDIIENGKTFKENAYIKAKTIALKYNKIVLADDSGLCVRALNYAPGIYSARFAGNHNDLENNKLLIEKLKGIEDRYAYFTCAMCLYIPNHDPIFVEGICEGEIKDEAKGKNGFGYDPHFYLPSLNKWMAELSPDEINKISHRGKALAKLKDVLDKL